MSGSGGSIFEVLQNILEAIGFGNDGEVLTSRGANKFPQFAASSGGAVTSVFGRTGAVVAENNDYDSTQIENLSALIGANLTDALNTLQFSLTAFTTLSGATVDFVVPSFAKKILVMLENMSVAGASINPGIQLGAGSTPETVGYLGTTVALTTGSNVLTQHSDRFVLAAQIGAAATIHGIATLALAEISTNTWTFSTSLGHSNATGVQSGGGSKAFSGVVDILRLTAAASTFDGGKAACLFTSF